MNKVHFLAAVMLASAVFTLAPVNADVLLLEKINMTASTSVPQTGLNMEQVTARFGTPSEKLPAIGEPPITRWIYPSFSVFFEYKLVIDSVVHPQVAGLTDPDS